MNFPGGVANTGYAAFLRRATLTLCNLLCHNKHRGSAPPFMPAPLNFCVRIASFVCSLLHNVKHLDARHGLCAAWAHCAANSPRPAPLNLPKCFADTNRRSAAPFALCCKKYVDSDKHIKQWNISTFTNMNITYCSSKTCKDSCF